MNNNNMKLTVLLTVLFMSLFSFGAYSQAQPVETNTLFRKPCLAGFEGCTNEPVDIRLSTGSFGATRTFTMTSAHAFPIFDRKIKVITPGGSSTGTYLLPSVIGDQIVIPSTDGILPYTVFIQKTATGLFKVSVSKFSL